MARDPYDDERPSYSLSPLKRREFNVENITDVGERGAEEIAGMVGDATARQTGIAAEYSEGRSGGAAKKEADMAIDPQTGDLHTGFGTFKGTPRNLIDIAAYIRKNEGKLPKLGMVPENLVANNFSEFAKGIEDEPIESDFWGSIVTEGAKGVGLLGSAIDAMEGSDDLDNPLLRYAKEREDEMSLGELKGKEAPWYSDTGAFATGAGSAIGQIIPTAASAIGGTAIGTATGGPAGAIAGATAGLTGGGQAFGEQAKEFYDFALPELRKMAPEKAAESPLYQQVFAENPTFIHDEVLQEVAIQGARMAGTVGAIPGAIEAIVGTKLARNFLGKFNVTKDLLAAPMEAISKRAGLMPKIGRIAGRGTAGGVGAGVSETAETMFGQAAGAATSGVGSSDPLEHFDPREGIAASQSGLMFGMFGGRASKPPAEFDPTEVLLSSDLGAALSENTDVDKGIDLGRANEALADVPHSDGLSDRQREIAARAAELEARAAPFQESLFPQGQPEQGDLLNAPPPQPELPWTIPQQTPQQGALPVEQPMEQPGLEEQIQPTQGPMTQPNLAERRAFQEMQGAEQPALDANGQQVALPPPPQLALRQKIGELSNERAELVAAIEGTQQQMESSGLSPRNKQMMAWKRNLPHMQLRISQIDSDLEFLDSQLQEFEPAGASPAPQPPPGAPQDLAPSGNRPMGVDVPPSPNAAPMSPGEAAGRAAVQSKRGSTTPAPAVPVAPPAPALEAPVALPGGEVPVTASTQEPAGDLRAQIRAVADPNADKRAVLVAPGDEGKIGRLPKGVRRYPGKQGILLTADEAAGKKYRAGQMSNDEMGQLTEGAAIDSAVAATEPGVMAVQAVDEAGNVAAEQVATPATAEAAIGGVEEQAGPGATARVIPTTTAVGRRRKKIEEEAAAPVVEAPAAPAPKPQKLGPKGRAAVEKSGGTAAAPAPTVAAPAVEAPTKAKPKPKPSKVPDAVTDDMKEILKDLKYGKAAIAAMSPAEAHRIIEGGIEYEPPGARRLREKKERDEAREAARKAELEREREQAKPDKDEEWFVDEPPVKDESEKGKKGTAQPRPTSRTTGGKKKFPKKAQDAIETSKRGKPRQTEKEKDAAAAAARRIADAAVKRAVEATTSAAEPAAPEAIETLIEMALDVDGATITGEKGVVVDTRVVAVDPVKEAKLQRTIEVHGANSKRGKDAQKQLSLLQRIKAVLKTAAKDAETKLRESLSTKDKERLKNQTAALMRKHKEKEEGKRGRPREKPSVSPLSYLNLTVAEARGYLRAARAEAIAERDSYNPDDSVFRIMFEAMYPGTKEDMADRSKAQRWIEYIADKNDEQLEVVLVTVHTSLRNSPVAKGVMRGASEVNHATDEAGATVEEAEALIEEAKQTPALTVHDGVQKDAANTLTDWIQGFERRGYKFTHPVRVMSITDLHELAPETNRREANAVYGIYEIPAMGRKEHVIAFNTEQYEKNPLAMLEEIGFQFANLVTEELYFRTDGRTRHALNKGFEKHLERQPGTFASDSALAGATPYTALRPDGTQMTTEANGAYGQQFQLWGARNAGLYLADPNRPINSAAERFWSDAATILKPVWKKVTFRETPDEAWRESLDRWQNGLVEIEPTMPATRVAWPGAPEQEQDTAVLAKEWTYEAVEQAIDGMDIHQMADWVAKNHPDHDQREIAKAAGRKIKELADAGVTFSTHLYSNSDYKPGYMNDARGALTMSRGKGKVHMSLMLRRPDAGEHLVGTRFETVLHELVHAATTASTTLGNLKHGPDTRTKAAVARLFTVQKAIVDHLKTRFASGEELTDFEAKLKRGQGTYQVNDVDEILAYGLTNREMQEYLKTIPYPKSKNSFWGELVKAVREYLNLHEDMESALDEVMSISEELMGTSAADLAGASKATGANWIKEMTPAGEKVTAQRGNVEQTFGVGDSALPDYEGSDSSSQKLGKKLARNATRAIDGIRGIWEPSKSGRFIGAAKDVAYQLMSMRDMVRMLESRGSAVAKPLKDWMTAFNKKSITAKQSQEEASKWVRQFKQLTPKQQHWVEELMAKATTYKIHPDIDWDAKPNQHLHSPKHERVDVENKQRWQELNGLWNKLILADPNIANIYRGMRDESAKLHEASYQLRLQRIDNTEKLSDANKTKLKALATQLYHRAQQGPYFPKKRFGDWIVSVSLPHQRVGKDGVVNGDFFDDENGAKEEAKQLRALHPDAKIEVKKTEDGWAVNMAVRAVSFYESEAEAHSPEAKKALMDEVRERYKDVEGGFEAAQAEMGDNPIISEPFLARGDYGQRKAMGSEFGIELEKLIKDGEIPNSLAEDLRFLQYQALPENSYQKQLLPRRDIMGASQDMVRAYASGMQAAANNYARLKHGDAIDANWEEALSASRKHNDTSAQRVMEELRKNQETVAQREREQWQEGALGIVSQINSVYSLGFSIPYALTNMAQPWLVAVPVLGAFANGRTGKVVGNVKASAYMKKAYSDAFGFFTKRAVQETVAEWRTLLKKPGSAYTESDFRNDMIKRFAKSDPMFAQVMKDLYDSGLLDYTFISAMSDAAKASGGAGELLSQFQRLSMAFPAQIEAMNRLVTAKAATNLARDEFLISDVKDATEMSQFASDIVAQTQGDYSRSNRARIFNRPVAGLALQFKQYMQMMYMLFGHNLVQVIRPGASKAERQQAVRTIRNLMMSHAAVAGVSGTPVAMAAKVVLWMAFSAFGEDDDDWKSVEQLQHEVLNDMFGEKAGEVVDQGLPRLLDMDLGDRMAFPDLLDTRFLGIKEGAKPSEGLDKVLSYAAGAPWANIKRFADGSAALAKGEGWEASKALPSGIRPVLQSIKMMQQGMVDGDGDVVIPANELSWNDMAIKSLGGTPARIARQYEEQREVKGTHARIMKERQRIMQKARNNEIEWSEVQEYNATVRRGFRITPHQLSQAKRGKAKREGGMEPKGEREVRRMLER